MRISFLIMGLNRVAKNLPTIVELYGANAKVITLEEVLSNSDLSAIHRWLKLTARNNDVLKLKRSDKLEQLDLQLTALMEKHPELADFDVANGDPLLYLIGQRSVSAEDARSRYGETDPLIVVDAVEEVLDAVMNYNFGYKFKKLLPDFFKESELKISALAKRDKWPARGSWNSSVPEKKRTKKEVNFSFLSKYSS